MKKFATPQEFVEVHEAAAAGDFEARLKVTAYYCRSAAGDLHAYIQKHEATVPADVWATLGPAVDDIAQYLASEDTGNTFDPLVAAELCGRASQAIAAWGEDAPVADLKVVWGAFERLTHIHRTMLEAIGYFALVMSEASSFRDAEAKVEEKYRSSLWETADKITAAANDAINHGTGPVPVSLQSR